MRLFPGADAPPCLVEQPLVVRLPELLAGVWREAVNTDSELYGGSGAGNMGAVIASDHPSHGQPASATITIPPLGALWLVPETEQ